MKLAHRQAGFTLIELLIVIIVLGILLALVGMTYSGVQAKNRNNQRQADINSLQTELEVFYAQYSVYPTLGQLNDVNYRKQYLKELKDDAIKDPRWSTKVTACTGGSQPTLVGVPTTDCYSYQATAADGTPCDNGKVLCAQYTLTTMLEGGEKYVKSSLN